MAIQKSTSALRQALRTFSTTPATRTSRQDRLGSAVAVGYWCTIVGAPLAGAYVLSNGARKDGQKNGLRPLSFRDCLPGSSLDDYAGAYMRLRR